MSDTTVNQFLSQAADAAARVGFVPTPPTPAADLPNGYLCYQRDTTALWAWDSNASAWVLVASGGASSPLTSVSVTLTNAQIKALPTTPVTIIAAPASGYRNRVIAASLVGRYTSGAYTNVNVTYASLVVQTGGAWITNPVINDITIPLDDLSRILGAVDLAVDLMVPPAFPWGWLNSPISSSDPSSQDAAVTEIAIDNNGSGNLTGGNAANTLKVTVYYTVEAL